MPSSHSPPATRVASDSISAEPGETLMGAVPQGSPGLLRRVLLKLVGSAVIRLREPRASTSGPARRSATIRVAARILKLRGDTVGKSVSDPGRPGIVHREGMAGIVRHSQTK